MTSNFLNTRFFVTETVRLSMSQWEDGDLFRSSVALLRKTSSGWQVDHESVSYGYSHDEEDLRYRKVDAGRRLVEQETGESLPLRFFRDNQV